MKLKVLVLGGKGFIGRHAVAALQQQGIVAVVGSSRLADPENSRELRHLEFEKLTAPKDWLAISQEFDVILNCVGILRPRGAASFEHVHHLAPAAIAEACHQTGTRFVHVSALGLSHNDRSGFLTSKRHGETAIMANPGTWFIVRPSLLDGEGGYGAAWLRGVSRLPIFARPADAQGQIAALTVSDLGEALARLCLASEQNLVAVHGRIFELGGSHSYNFETYIRGLRKRYSSHRAIAVPIPGWVARLGAHICDLLHFTPFSFGHWELLRKDNVPNPNRLSELLGRTPEDVIK